MKPTGTEQVWTLGGLLEWTEKHLAAKGVESPRLDAQVLLAHVVGCRRIDLYGLRQEEVAEPEVRQRYRELIRRRLEGCPVAYLVGRKEFYGLALAVGPAVLIPRPDTEHVVMECLGLAKKLPQPRVLDVGTGSGAIAIALAKHHAGAAVTATDRSAEALAVAAQNAAAHQLGERIRFLEGDLFAPVPAGEAFDFIVSNPPYIATEDLPTLPPGVRDYEPRVALDGGPGGFVVFDRLVAAAREWLAPDGFLIVEIGSPQEGPARAKIAAGGYALGATVHDYSGHPRVLVARRG